MKNIQSPLDYHIIKTLCDEYYIEDYTINPDGSIDVDADVIISERRLTKIPLRFGRVSGNFWCQDNSLNTLNGCPEFVGGDFRCSQNELASLEGAPKIVEGSLYCANNKFSDMRGCPEIIGKYLVCHDNYMTSLQGAPKEVMSINCENNSLTTLEYCPRITGTVPCMFMFNKYAKIVGIELKNFKDNAKVNAFVKYQNHYEIWDEEWHDGLNMKNFKELIDEINDGLL
jgi:hypothetical protein